MKLKYLKKKIIIWALAVTLTLKIETDLFAWHSSSWWCITIPNLVTKRFVGLEDTIWTNIDILTLCCDLGLECSNTMFHKTLWLIKIYHQTNFGCQRISSSEDIVERVRFWSDEPSLWPWPWRQQTICLCKTLWLIMLHHHTKSGNKMYCGSEDITWTNIHWHFESLMWHWPWT